MKFLDSITNAAKNCTIKAVHDTKENAPTIWMIVGGALIVVGVVSACKRTLKVDEENPQTVSDEVKETKEKVEKIHKAKEEGKTESGLSYSEEDYKKDIVAVYSQQALKFVKRYWAPAVEIGGGMFLAGKFGFGVMKNRYLETAATAGILKNGYDILYNNVKEKYGEDEANRLRNDLEEKTIVSQVTDPETGETKTETKTVDVPKEVPKGKSQFRGFERLWNPSSAGWIEGDDIHHTANTTFVKGVEDRFNKYSKTKYDSITVNDAYEELGYKRVKGGQNWGWYPGEIVDFGIGSFSKRLTKCQEDWNLGINDAIWLTFPTAHLLYGVQPQKDDFYKGLDGTEVCDAL